MAVYLQVPFQETPPPSDESTFVRAVVHEIERCAPLPAGLTRILYIGGGRPSLLSESALCTLVAALRDALLTSSLEEATLELHPADASPSFLDALREVGITRLSIDARSLVDDELESRRSSHSVADIKQILRTAPAVGVEHLSVDLVFGGSRSSLAAWKASLHRAVGLGVPHLALHERRPAASPEDGTDQADQLDYAMRFLRAKGYDQYELTHFARPGHRSRYQEHVYAHGDVIGLGPGAESFQWPDRTDPATAERWSNVADAAAYVDRLLNDASPVAQREDPDRRTLAREYILLGLRTSEGLTLDLLNDRYGVALHDRLRTTLGRLFKEGLLHDDPDRVRLTPRGRLRADAITRRLMRVL